ncbi:MAG: XdhC family protein [Pseudonocardia sp.]|nr:XdhC family protein [Pseudonocardia sp.]
MRPDLLSRVDGLRTGRTPFVLATVVRAERPTSAKPGDCALVLADGTIDGFVGGVCAESTVRLESLRLLEAGESGLLRITPRAGDDDARAEEGVRTVGNPCLSGGTLEIFLEAMIPPTLVVVYGEAPIARAIVRVGHSLDWDVRASLDPAAPIAPDTCAVVVASHGRDEAAVLRAALAEDVPYVALVASRKRAAGVLDELADLGVPRDQRTRIHAPAGLDIGARTASEVALSVLADIVAQRPRVHLPPPAPAQLGRQVALDPVCGMDVAVTPASLCAAHAGETVYFCGSGCRQAFLDDPARYAT